MWAITGFRSLKRALITLNNQVVIEPNLFHAMATMWDAAYSVDIQTWDPDSVWDVDFASALEQEVSSQRTKRI